MEKPTYRLPQMFTTANPDGMPVGAIKANMWFLKEGGKQITAFHHKAILTAEMAGLLGLAGITGANVTVMVGVPVKSLDNRPDKEALIAMARQNRQAKDAYTAAKDAENTSLKAENARLAARLAELEGKAAPAKAKAIGGALAAK